MSSLKKQVELLTETVENLAEELADLKLELKERWVEIEADPEYDISSLGRVRKRKNGFVPKISIHKSTGYYRVILNNKSHHIHRLLAAAFIPNPENKPQVDHRDGNRQNNSLSNLRWCTHAENCRNRKKQCNNTSGFTGVSFNASTGKYTAQVNVDNESIFLGYFHTAEEANAAREKVAKELHGEFFCKR